MLVVLAVVALIKYDWISAGLWGIASLLAQFFVFVPWIIIVGIPLVGLVAAYVQSRLITERLYGLTALIVTVLYLPLFWVAGYRTLSSLGGTAAWFFILATGLLGIYHVKKGHTHG